MSQEKESITLRFRRHFRYLNRKHFPLERKNFIQKFMAIGGFISFFFGLWQMDLICSLPVWQTNTFLWEIANKTLQVPYSNTMFEFGRIDIFGHIIKFTTSVGASYDLCQAFLVIGLILTVLAFWLWDSEPQGLNTT